MLPIKKITIGIRPDRKMFRVQSNWGDIADAVLAHTRKDKSFEKDYFTQVRTSQVRDSVSLLNDDLGHLLTVTLEDIVFVKDLIPTGRSFNRQNTLDEFKSLWQTVDSVLNITAVRRIGIVGEARIADVKDPSAKLLRNLTKLDATPHLAKFSLRYERRYPTAEGLAPDVSKDDFKNIIFAVYDSAIDTEHPADDAVSLMLDYQRYYAPAISKDVSKETERHVPEFEKRWESFSGTLAELGIGSK